MDIPIYLLFGLATGGYLLRNKRQKQTKETFETQKHHQSNGPNILSSQYFDKVQSINEQAAADKFHKAYSDINTNIIPFYFGWLNNSNLKHQANPEYDPVILKQELANAVGPGGTTEYGEKAKTPVDIVGEIANEHQNYASVPHRDEPPSGGTEPRGHNNMVPFFGSTVRQNMNVDNPMAAKKLESFTGHFKLEQQHKQEIPTMFAPAPQNLDQLVPLREMDRFVPSNLGVRNNELPFKQEIVGPGLNQGFTATPSGGFHNPVRIMPKDNDELNVNPRTTHEGRVLRGKGPVPQRTSQSLSYKYRPETLVTNFDGERNFITTGAVKNPRARAKTFVRPTARQQFTEVKGPMGANRYNRPENLFAKNKISDRQNFRNTPYRNLVGVEGKKSQHDAHYSYENRRNERSVTGLRRVVNNMKAVVDMVKMSFFDNAKKTRKESYIHNPRDTGNVAPKRHKSVNYNPADEARMTHRETTAATDHSGFVAKGKGKGINYNPAETARTTGRETTEDNAHAGQLRQSAHKGQVYDPTLLRTTVKELLENNSHKGQLAGIRKSRVLNSFERAKTTIRETHEDNGHTGHLSGGKHARQVYDAVSGAKTTNRETLENNSHVGHLSGGKRARQVYDTASGAKTTNRETLETNSHIGNMTGGRKRGQGYNPQDAPKTTIRETTSVTSHTGNMTGGTRKGQGYNPTDTAKTTMRETTSVNSHAGQLTGGRKPGKTINTADEMRTTGRETIENNSHAGHVQRAQMKGGAYNPDEEARTTGRETVENNSHAGHVQRAGRKGKSYNPADEARTTGRETVENNSHAGHIQRAGRKGGAYNPADEARTTVRETTETNSHAGHVQRGKRKGRGQTSDEAKTTGRETTGDNSHIAGVQRGKRKGAAYNESDVAKTTGRETLENNSHAGNLSGGRKRGKGYNPADEARTTHRETTENTDYVGIMRDSNQAEGGGYQITRFEDKATQRQFSHFGYTGGAAPKGLAEGQQLYDAAYNARTNTNKEKIAKGRVKQNPVLPLHAGKRFTNIEVKKLEEDRVNHYSSAPGPTHPVGRIPEFACRLTSFRNSLPSEANRLDTTLLKPFKKNPLTQSLNSFA